MINTINSKAAQLEEGFYRFGTGEIKMLIIGSCRTIPYLNYFYDWNKQNNDKITVSFLDPFNFCYDKDDNRVNVEEKITSMEGDSTFKAMLKSTKIFVHEHYANFGMFNCDRNAAKNVYQFGMNPELDITICNFNDYFILFGDIVSLDVAIRKKAIADYNVLGKLSEQTANEMYGVSTANLTKFYDVCRKSDTPEMADYFADNFLQKRMHFNSNHVTKHFTLFIFTLLFTKFLNKLGFKLTYEFINYLAEQPDMFANNYTHLTELDVFYYNYDWPGEEVIPLKEKL